MPIGRDYWAWLEELIDQLPAEAQMYFNHDPAEVDAAFSQLRPMMFDGGASPREAADAISQGIITGSY